MNKKITLFAVGLGSLLIVGSLAAGTAFAAGPSFGVGHGLGMPNGGYGGSSMSAAAVGTVSAVSGDTITLTGKNGTTYTIIATNATVTKNGASSSVGDISNGDTLIVQGTVSGTTVTATTIRDGVGGYNKMGSGVSGTVATINGSTFTVTSKHGLNGVTNATYTVNAGSATVTKNGASSSVSNIAVGDTVYVQGTVSGTTVTATTIRDGLMQGSQHGSNASPTPIITGNGEPVIGGTVTQVSGDIITVTNKSNVTYSINAASATVEKGGASSSISSVVVGDNIIVQGTVNGTDITASSVIDSGSGTNSASSNTHPGFFGQVGGAIGNFFHKLFGFF